MIVVADTGPLISLAHIKQLDILEKLYPDYIIAHGVYQELVSYKRIDFDERDLSNMKKHIRKINFEIHPSLSALGLGEAESIALLKEVNGDAFLTDDMEARRVAESMHITCFGTLALLLQAKSAGLIETLKPILLELIEHKRYYSRDLIELVLIRAGEF